MARARRHITIRIRSISGLVQCLVCGTLISFELERAEFDREIPCCLCHGSTELLDETVICNCEVRESSAGGRGVTESGS